MAHVDRFALFCLGAGLWVGSVSACASAPAEPSKYPPRQKGCEVQVLREAPTFQTDNIGAVQSSCDESVSDAECLLTLKDEACKLGADTVWGVSDKPTMQLGKKKFSGRAVHQK
jgi:hypothetical protein